MLGKKAICMDSHWSALITAQRASGCHAEETLFRTQANNCKRFLPFSFFSPSVFIKVVIHLSSHFIPYQEIIHQIHEMTTTYFVASVQPAITVEGENGKLSAEAELKQFQLQQLPPRVTLGFAPSRALWGPLRGTRSGRAMNAAERLRTGREGDCHPQLSHT